MSGEGRVLAVDLGGTRLRAAISPSATPELCLDVAHGASGQQPLAVAQVVAWLRTAIAAESIAAIGVSVAGTVAPDTGIVTVADNLGWRQTPLAETMSSAFGVPVWIDTDTFCGARAERTWGNVGREAVLYVAIGTGIGHAWMLDGHLWRGAGSAANLFGHLIVRPGGRACYCGNTGCLCQYAAGPAIGAALAARPEAAGAATLAEADEALALAVANALTLMNPAVVILGGGISDVWPEPRSLAVRVAALVHPEVRPIQIRRSALGAQANIIGAGVLAADGIAATRADSTKQEER